MTGLVGWWPLHENSGKARDLSGNGNHGSLNGGVTQGVAGKGGLTSYSFEGNKSSLSVDDSDELDFSSSSDFTICSWFRTDSITDSNPHSILCKRDRNTVENYGYEILLTSNELRFNIKDKSGAGSVASSSQSYDDSKWHQVTAQRRASERIEIYVDGNRADSAEDVGDIRNSGNLFVGQTDEGLNKSYKFYWNGKISSTRIYNRALSPQEIQTLYEWGNGDYASPPNKRTDSSSAVSRWKFDGDVKDSWGSNDGMDKTSSVFSSDAIRGQAKKFDGDDDYVNLGDMGSLGSNSSQLTYSIWMSNEDTARRNLYGFNKDTSSTHNIQINSNTDNSNDPGNLRYIFKDSDGSALRANLSRTVPLNSGNLNHLVFTQDLSANRLNFYFNSSRIPISYSLTQTPSAEDFPMDLYLGNQNYKGSANTPISGAIDEFRIYNRVLEPHEVFQLYQWGTRGRDMRKLTVNKR
jgi:hypothetical protein